MCPVLLWPCPVSVQSYSVAVRSLFRSLSSHCPASFQLLPGLSPVSVRSMVALSACKPPVDILVNLHSHARAHTHMHTHRSSLLVKVGKLEEAATIHRLVCEYDPLHTNKVCLCLTLHVVYWSNSARGLLV